MRGDPRNRVRGEGEGGDKQGGPIAGCGGDLGHGLAEGFDRNPLIVSASFQPLQRGHKSGVSRTGVAAMVFGQV